MWSLAIERRMSRLYPDFRKHTIKASAGWPQNAETAIIVPGIASQECSELAQGDAMTHHEPAQLPDLFCFQDGTRVQHPVDWPARRLELLDTIIPLEYGGLPPTPRVTWGEELHTSTVSRLGGARYVTVRVVTEAERQFAFLLYLLVPPGPGPFPVVLNGDACWGYVTDEIAAEVLRRGNILAQFNRVEIAADVRSSDRISGIYPLHPAESTARWQPGRGAITAASMCWQRWNSSTAQLSPSSAIARREGQPAGRRDRRADRTDLSERLRVRRRGLLSAAGFWLRDTL